MQDPRNQKQIKYLMFIVLIIPVFATVQHAGIGDLQDDSPSFFFELNFLTSFFESFVMLAFLEYLYLISNIEDDVIPPNLVGREVHLIFPLSCCFPHWHLDQKTLWSLRYMLYQYITLNPITSFNEYICLRTLSTTGMCNKMWLDFLDLAVGFGSISLAIGALLMFYHAVEEEVKGRRPLVKFLCIKGIISLMFFQGVVVSMLFKWDILKSSNAAEESLLENGIESSLSVVEMCLVFTFAFLYAYDPEEYSSHDLLNMEWVADRKYRIIVEKSNIINNENRYVNYSVSGNTNNNTNGIAQEGMVDIENDKEYSNGQYRLAENDKSSKSLKDDLKFNNNLNQAQEQDKKEALDHGHYDEHAKVDLQQVDNYLVDMNKYDVVYIQWEYIYQGWKSFNNKNNKDNHILVSGKKANEKEKEKGE